MSARTALRPITLHLRDRQQEVIGSAELRLALVEPEAATDPGAWAITHGFGNVAQGTHTEVVFTDATAAALPEHVADSLVRAVAHEVYPGGWAFHYRPDEVPAAVLGYGSRLRERVEVSAVEVWA